MTGSRALGSLLLAALVALAAALGACGEKPAPRPVGWHVEPTPKTAARHRAHEHAHGHHPHAGGGHHHHPHPHPHLDGPNGHHHPY